MTATIEKPPVEGGNSVKGKRWAVREYDERAALALAQKFELPEIVARILAMRGIAPSIAGDFLEPKLRNYLPDPNHLLDMEKAAKRLSVSVTNGEKVVIFGDYDVDGATSSALLKRFFAMVGLEVGIYIPDRIREGYGPNINALRKIKENGAKLVITVDCGSLAFEPVKQANDTGLETIIVDHHISEAQLPEACAVINPNRLDETSPHKNLAAVGVAFLLAVAVNRELRQSGWYKNRPEPNLLQLLDLVALGTVCDVMKLTGLNRAYVTQGLKVIAKRSNTGLRALADVARLEGTPASYHLGFVLGPRINAGGRVGESHLGAQLLSTDNSDEACEIALKLHKYNEERRALEAITMEQAFEQAEEQKDAPIIFVTGTEWHQGVIGIVASRLKEKYNRPAAVISLENGIGKGSARSVGNVDLGAAITSARMHGLLIDGGGHAAAAGFSVAEKNLQALHDFLQNHLKSAIAEYHKTNTEYAEGILATSSITIDLAKTLEKIAPFGSGNPEPRFIIKDVVFIKPEIVGEKHIKTMLGTKSTIPHSSKWLKAIAFNATGTPLADKITHAGNHNHNIIAKIKRNIWQGYERVEVIIEDILTHS